MPLYIYTLSKELICRGHDVTIIAPKLQGEILEYTRMEDIAVYDFGSIPSTTAFDIMHLNEYQPSEFALRKWPTIPAVATVHSEWPCERPYIDNRIFKYICIRPSIQDKIINQDKIPLGKTEVIYNGFDTNRFNMNYAPGKHDRKIIIFTGTVDHLRMASGLHMIDRAHREDFELWFVGKKHARYLDNVPMGDRIKYLPETWNIEDYIKRADETAGIVLGRTTVEGWLCGKSGWIYDIDQNGKIMSYDLHEPPDDIYKFDVRYVTDHIVALYKKAIGAARK